MNEYARVTTNANGLGTFAMTEGYTLIATIVILVVGTLVLNGCDEREDKKFFDKRKEKDKRFFSRPLGRGNSNFYCGWYACICSL